MAEAGQSLHCLICRVSIKQCHLGIDSCRACAVFYKRTLNLKRPLKCKGGNNDCLTSDPTSSCRMCRFSRFKDIFDRACSGEKPEWIEKEEAHSDSETMSERQSIDETPATFIDHNSYFDFAPSCSETPLLDRMKKAYSMMCLIRKSGEIGPLQHSTMHQVLRNDDITLLPGKYSDVVPNMRIFFSSLIDFAKSSFDNFRDLSAEDKHFVIFRNFKLIQSLDLAYRGCHYFPNDQTGMCSYTTFVNGDTVEEFLSDCPFDVNKAEVIEEFKRSMRKNVNINKNHFKRVKPSSEEYVALVGLALWNDRTSSICEELFKLVVNNQRAIMNELHKMYVKNGVTNYASRLGELLCLLVSVERILDISNEDLHVYRMMNLFNEAFDDFRP